MSGITKFDERMFAEARKVAATSSFDNFHLGCVIVYKKHIVGSGTNSYKTHPMQAQYNKYRKFNKTTDGVKHSLHAEIAAINSISYPIGLQIEWDKVKIYIYRISPGKPRHYGLACPCAACKQAIRDLGIKHIYYTGENSYIYERLN